MSESVFGVGMTLTEDTAALSSGRPIEMSSSNLEVSQASPLAAGRRVTPSMSPRTIPASSPPHTSILANSTPQLTTGTAPPVGSMPALALTPSDQLSAAAFSKDLRTSMRHSSSTKLSSLAATTGDGSASYLSSEGAGDGLTPTAGGLKSFNPFKVHPLSKRKWTFDRRRWAHVYLKTAAPQPSSAAAEATGPARLEPIGIQDVNWSSLSEPAVLPITTDYIPAPAELTTRYTKGEYQLELHISNVFRPMARHRGGEQGTPMVNGMSRFRWLCDVADGSGGVGGSAGGTGGGNAIPSNVIDAAARMVGYRLDNDFQIVDPSYASKEWFPWMHDVNGRPLCALSTGHRINVIMYQHTDLMEVKRYLRKGVDLNWSHSSTFCMWDGVTQRPVERTRSFSTVPRDFTVPNKELNWNTLDTIACLPDEYRNSSESLDADYVRYNHLEFILVPMPSAASGSAVAPGSTGPPVGGSGSGSNPPLRGSTQSFSGGDVPTVVTQPSPPSTAEAVMAVLENSVSTPLQGPLPSGQDLASSPDVSFMTTAPVASASSSSLTLGMPAAIKAPSPLVADNAQAIVQFMDAILTKQGVRVRSPGCVLFSLALDARRPAPPRKQRCGVVAWLCCRLVRCRRVRRHMTTARPLRWARSV